MNAYELVEGNGDTITCDDCSKIVGVWWSSDHAICDNCHAEREGE